MTDYNLKRQRQREETEQKIIDSAIKLFGENGYAKTSIKEIANAAGVANGLVGKYFATKEILLTDAYRFAITISYPVVRGEKEFSESIKRLVRNTVEVYDNKPECYRFFNTMINASDLPPEYIAARREFFENTSVYPFIVREQEKGIIHCDDLYSFFLLFMKTIYNIVELYSRMSYNGDKNAVRGTIELIVDTVYECIKEIINE